MEDELKGRRGWVAPAVFAVFCLAVVGAVLFFLREDKSMTAAEQADVLMDSLSMQRRELGGQSVEYCWDGTASGVDVTAATLNGGISQASGKANGQCIRMGSTSRLSGLYVSVQNTGSSGSVECYIKVDGREVTRNSSDGGYTIASCSY